MIFYQCIAVNMFYNFAFECKMIGRSVQLQIHIKQRESVPHFDFTSLLLDFARNNLFWSNYTQKTFDRTFKCLSIGTWIN